MAVIKFSIPDAWVQENNYVYGVLTEDTTRERIKHWVHVLYANAEEL